MSGILDLVEKSAPSNNAISSCLEDNEADDDDVDDDHVDDDNVSWYSGPLVGEEDQGVLRKRLLLGSTYMESCFFVSYRASP